MGPAEKKATIAWFIAMAICPFLLIPWAIWRHRENTRIASVANIERNRAASFYERMERATAAQRPSSKPRR